ncbi:MAG: phosphate signaling complex protein PhoU [Bacteroidota bacterium]|nr:phosphate signaling complex protein PhoU [Bacteroidota bacterium]
MTHFETEIVELKEEVKHMWLLVRTQLSKTLDALVNFDKDLAREVTNKEKRVNSYELKIDLDCENIFAIYQPVAIDLRFLLAVLKINSNLERIGDIAEGVAKYIIDTDTIFGPELIEESKVMEMFGEAINMFDDTLTAFETEDTSLARKVFKKDEFLDDINQNANENIESYIKQHPDDINQALYALSIIRKLERVGDQSKNIAEEIIFYLEAKVLKHHKKI